MTTEGQGDQAPDLDERGLVIRSEQTGLDNLTRAPYLVHAGFSPRLPEILMRLNDVLPHPLVKHIGLTLHPGSVPQIDASVNYSFIKGGYTLFVDSYPSTDKAEVSLLGEGSRFKIDDIKDFCRVYIPGKAATLQADASPHLIEPREDFEEDLQTVTGELLRTWFEELPAQESSPHIYGEHVDYPYGTPHANVMLEGQKWPLFILNFRMEHYDRNTVGCDVSKFRRTDTPPPFYYSGSPEEVESIMEGLVTLFDKPSIYPFRVPEKDR